MHQRICSVPDDLADLQRHALKLLILSESKGPAPEERRLLAAGQRHWTSPSAVYDEAQEPGVLAGVSIGIQ